MAMGIQFSTRKRPLSSSSHFTPSEPIIWIITDKESPTIWEQAYIKHAWKRDVANLGRQGTNEKPYVSLSYAMLGFILRYLG